MSTHSSEALKMRAAGLRLMLGELIKGANLLKLTGA